MKLNNDVSRCKGSLCTRKLECARYVALSEVLPDWLGYSVGDNYCSVDTGHGGLAWHWSYIILESNILVGNDTEHLPTYSK